MEDRGVGLDYETKESRGMGMIAMRERAALLSGRIQFLRPEQGGTLVKLDVPLEPGRALNEGLNKSAYCSPTITPWCAAVFAVSLRTSTTSRVVAEACNGVEAVELARSTRPDVIIMDMAMPDLNGSQAIIEILKFLPGAAIVVLSMYGEANYVRNAINAGARGYLSKTPPMWIWRRRFATWRGAEGCIDPKLQPSPLEERNAG